MKVKEWVERLSKWEDQEQEICVNMWGREDIIERAEDLKEQEIIPQTTEIDNEIVDSILSDMESNQDCGLGISWDTVDFYIEAKFQV